MEPAEDVLERMHQLLYRCDGGSGYPFSRADVLAMPLWEFRWWCGRLHRQRRDEIDAHEKAKKQHG